jgi:hypothetical protein
LAFVKRIHAGGHADVMVDACGLRCVGECDRHERIGAGRKFCGRDVIRCALPAQCRARDHNAAGKHVFLNRTGRTDANDGFDANLHEFVDHDAQAGSTHAAGAR